MAIYTLNNLANPRDIVTFTDIPNIVKVTEPISGSRAEFIFTFLAKNFQSTVTADTQYYVSFLGESVSNVMSPQNANNRRFYISSQSNSTAASFCDALRNCASISAQFDIYLSEAQVILRSRTIGKVWGDYPNYLQTNIPSTYMTTNGTDGASTSDYLNSKIKVDIINSDREAYDKYVTTLEKNFYDGECAFDISPVLATFSEYGKTQPYHIRVNLQKQDGTYRNLTTFNGHTTIGYQANQSDKYLYSSTPMFLLNRNRDIKLYTYEKTIDFSYLTNEDGWSVLATFKDSLGNNLRQQAFGGAVYDKIGDCKVEIPNDIYEQTYTVQLLNNDGDTVTFNVIKPLKAAETNQRVYWRNEYGGIAFYDFTGERSESDSVNIDTYEKNIYDMYETDVFERKMIYSSDYTKKVKIKSHIMEENGKYIFNSLMRSKRVWTVINGKTYYIIPTNIEVNEIENYNGLYQATLTYEYSDL